MNDLQGIFMYICGGFVKCYQKKKRKMLMNKTKNLLRECGKLGMLFAFGGLIYCIIEILYKGDTHWSMLVTGGIAFVLVGGLNSYLDGEIPLLLQMTVSSVIITMLEYVCGCIVNLHFGLNVWDYSGLPFNINGQICLLFVFLWFLMAVPAIFLDDYLRTALFGEPRHKYTLIHFPKNEEDLRESGADAGL